MRLAGCNKTSVHELHGKYIDSVKNILLTKTIILEYDARDFLIDTKTLIQKYTNSNDLWSLVLIMFAHCSQASFL